MKRALLVSAAALGWAVTLAAQEPTVAPRLARLAERDTVVPVWFFGRAGVPLAEVARVVNDVGGRERRRSRWLHAVSADLPTTALAVARRRTEFRRLQPVATFVRPAPPTGEPVFLTPAWAAADSSYGPSATPLERLNVFPLVHHGYRGAGVTIAIFDTGFETGLPGFDSANVVAQHDFVLDDSIVRNQPGDTLPSGGPSNASTHGTQVWALLGANVPGDIIGIAPEADYLLAKTEDVRSETRVEEDNWVAAIEWADSLGADIVTSSLTYFAFNNNVTPYSAADLNGDVAVTTVAADSAAARGIVVVNAAGNSGPGFRTVTTPGDGDSVITVGAEDFQGNLASFSSRGPTADGRLKPDLVAPGVQVFVLGPTGYARVNGTSFSTPLVAGVAALYRQIHPLHTPQQVIDAFRASASNRFAPDSLRGWGRPDAAAAVVFPRGIRVTSPADTLLSSVTPIFTWATPEVPTFVPTLTHRLTVATDTLFSQIVLDTVVQEPGVTLGTLIEGTRLSARITAYALGDSARLVTPRLGEFVAPAWAEILTLSDPDGATVRDLRPEFAWRSPEVASPPGPFSYDVYIIRADDGIVDLQATDVTTTSYTPTTDLERNTPYRWRLVVHLDADSAIVESQGTFLVIDDTAPTTTLLYQNFPNPFPNSATATQTTCIWFDLAQAGRVRVDVLDIRGRRVQNLVPGDAFATSLQPGRYGRPEIGQSGRCDPRLEWNGTAEDGTPVPRGVYLIRLETPAGTQFRRVVFLGGGT